MRPQCSCSPGPPAAARSLSPSPSSTLPHPSRAELRRAGDRGVRSQQAAVASDSRDAPSQTGRRPRAAAPAARPHYSNTQHAHVRPVRRHDALCWRGGRRRRAAGRRARQDMTTAPGDSPPSRISSQPTRCRPRARRKALTRPTNQDCSANSSARPCSARRAWQRAQPCQRSLGHCARGARPLKARRACAHAAPGPERSFDHPPCAAGAAAGGAAPGRLRARGQGGSESRRGLCLSRGRWRQGHGRVDGRAPRLVAADVDVRAGEQRQHLQQHGLQEVEDLLLTLARARGQTAQQSCQDAAGDQRVRAGVRPWRQTSSNPWKRTCKDLSQHAAQSTLSGAALTLRLVRSAAPSHIAARRSGRRPLRTQDCTAQRNIAFFTRRTAQYTSPWTPHRVGTVPICASSKPAVPPAVRHTRGAADTAALAQPHGSSAACHTLRFVHVMFAGWYRAVRSPPGSAHGDSGRTPNTLRISWPDPAQPRQHALGAPAVRAARAAQPGAHRTGAGSRRAPRGSARAARSRARP